VRPYAALPVGNQWVNGVDFMWTDGVPR